MSPSNGPPNVSPSGGGNGNHNREAGAGSNRSFSSPDAHRPSSTNNDVPLISPHHLGSHPQSFFPPQQQQQPPLSSMRPTTPGSPGSVKNAKNNNGSILERALASTIKTEPVTPALSVSTAAAAATAASVVLTNCIDTSSTALAGHMGQMQEHWHQQQQQAQYGEVLGPPEVFMKNEIDIGNLEYDLNYSNAMSAGGQPGGPGSGVHQGALPLLPPGHHHLGSNRGGHVHHQLVHHQEDNLHSHSPSQYSMAAAATQQPLQQPPWVR